MASGAEEGVAESGSAARGSGLSQQPQAGPLKAAVGSECPICLGAVRKPAFVAYCMHQFCFRCIRHWARGSQACPVCRQALEQVLHSVRGDDDYELFVVGLPARLRRRMAMERARRRCPQRRYDLRRRPAPDPPSVGAGSSQRQGAAPGPSMAPAQAAPASSTSREPTTRTGPDAPPDPQDGRE